MRTYFTCFLLFIFTALSVQAQVPQGFNYQAAVRDANGNLVVNQNVNFRFNILQGSATSAPVYTETHSVMTDAAGQASLIIGQGTPTLGTFNTIDWSLGSYFIALEVDTGSGYIPLGSTQLMSVPYALYAANSNSNLDTVLENGNDAGAEQIKNLADPTDVQDAVTKGYVDGLTQIPAGNNPGDILVWDGNAWTVQPGNNTQTGITLSTTATSIVENTSLNFVVTDQAGNDVTSTSSITVNGNSITGSSYTFPLIGNYIVNATNGTFTSNDITITVTTSSYTQKVLVEQYTGTWAGWNPRLKQSVATLTNTTNGNLFIPVEHHNGDNFAVSNVESILRNTFGIQGFPTGYLGRRDVWASISSDDMDPAQPQTFLTSNSPASAGLAINSVVNGSNIDATIQIGFDVDHPNSKLVAYLVEDDLIENQANFTNNYGGVNPILNFSHQNVFRASFSTDVLGDVLPSGQAVIGNVYSTTLTTAIPTGGNTANMKIVAFLVNANNEVINVQVAAVGANQPFD